MELDRLSKRAERLFVASDDEPAMLRPLPGVLLLRHRCPTQFSATVYDPVLCLILQGQKETRLGERTFRLRPGDSLVVSHDLPVDARITRAREDEPYLALILSIDLAILRSLYDETGATHDDEHASALAAHRADARLLDTLDRTLALVDDPVERSVMGPALQRELHFRMLMAPHGAMLRRLLRHDSHASHIARAIAHIRQDFRAPLTVPELARDVGMSQSSFHKQFRAITSTTPLQYQKELRLLEARRLLATGEHTVASAAFDVGYASASQFSREYSRKFGVSPSET
jgi:AraC-like DNA-binding protein